MRERLNAAWRRRLGHVPAGDDRGAILILVLGLIAVAGIMSGAMLEAVSSDLANTRHFSNARGLQYDAASATNLAIQSIRYKPLLSTSQTLNASPPSSCFPGAQSPLQGSNGYTISVWCSTVWNPTSAATRVVTFSACQSTASASACAANPVLQAVVTFDDYPPGLTAPSTGKCDVFCGAGLTLDSWIAQPVVPSVSGISTNSGSAGGGTSLTITGTGFVSGQTSVNFVQESGGTPHSNVVVQAPTNSVSVNGSGTSVTATTPSVISGTTYFVTVSTPSGTSAYGPVFTFNPVTSPTVTSVTPSSGATTGGTALTITGTGFRSDATVNLAPSGGGSGISATHVSVISATQITAITPSVTGAASYNVIVTTSAGSSAAATGNKFTYGVLVPTANSVSPASGTAGGGTTITVTGSGFLSSGMTVTFTLVKSDGITADTTHTANGKNVTVNSSTSLTVTTPAVSTAGTYFVTVTNSAGTSTYFPEFSFT